MAYAGGRGECILLNHLVQMDTPIGLARSTRARSTKRYRMVSPKTLRALSEQGKKDKDKREQEERKEYDRKAREKRMEKAAKDHAEAQRRIANLDYDMELAAKNGRTSIRVSEVYTRVVASLEGVERIIADHYIKKGFEVDIEIADGPEIRFEPDYIYYLTVRW